MASITCPICKWVSFNPTDVAEGYCGHCAAYTTASPMRDGEKCQICDAPLILVCTRGHVED